MNAVAVTNGSALGRLSNPYFFFSLLAAYTTQRSQLIHTNGKLVADDYQIAICTLHELKENKMYQHIKSIHVIDFLDNTQVVSEIDVAN